MLLYIDLVSMLLLCTSPINVKGSNMCDAPSLQSSFNNNYLLAVYFSVMDILFSGRYLCGRKQSGAFPNTS